MVRFLNVLFKDRTIKERLWISEDGTKEKPMATERSVQWSDYGVIMSRNQTRGLNLMVSRRWKRISRTMTKCGRAGGRWKCTGRSWY